MARWAHRVVAAISVCALGSACATQSSNDPVQRPLPSAAAQTALGLEDRCALLSSVLVHPPPSSSGQSQLSAFELALTRTLALSDGKLLAYATIRGPQAGEQPLFQRGESCGDRLRLVTQPALDLPSDATSFYRLAVTVSGSSHTFTLTLSTRDGPPDEATFPALHGEARRDGVSEWKIFERGSRSAKRPRLLDAKPTANKLPTSLPAGEIQAGFRADTGGDVMSSSALESGLVLIVRYADEELRQTIASCSEVTRGSALGDVSGNVLDLATCDGSWRVVASDHEVRAEREGADGKYITVASIQVPAHRTAAAIAP